MTYDGRSGDLGLIAVSNGLLGLLTLGNLLHLLLLLCFHLLLLVDLLLFVNLQFAFVLLLHMILHSLISLSYLLRVFRRRDSI